MIAQATNIFNAFQGFTPKTLKFLRELACNNNKIWFDAHKADYEADLLRPLQALATDLRESMLAIDPLLEVTPAVNRTISRIYRDTRFTKDKSPYKTTMWITFKRPAKEWQNAPHHFFEITPETYRYGMGFYSAAKETMDRFRAALDAQPQKFLQAIAFYAQQQVFRVEGEMYKKPLKAAYPEEIQTWYQRKNLYLVCNRPADAQLFTRALLDELRRAFQMVAPFYHNLWQWCVT